VTITDVLSALVAADPELASFADGYAGADLATLDLHDAETVAGLGVAPERAAAVAEKLRARQRVARVAPTPAVAEGLLAAGLDSAQRIAALPEHRFVREHAALFGGDEHAARAAHQRAVDVKAIVQHLHANLRDVLSPHLAALRADPVADALRDYVTQVPDYRELFGPLDALACDHCASIFGPAAYFLDLMRVTEDYITDVNAPPAGRSLRERRPDLFSLDLTCANTDTPLPTLEIVASVLARRISDELPIAGGVATAGAAGTITLAADASPDDGAYAGMLVAIVDGTGKGQLRTITAYAGATKVAQVDTEWAAVPDTTSAYRVTREAYAALAAAPYPFDLPWNLPLERTRRALGALGTGLADVYRELTGPATTGTAQAAGTATLQLATGASSDDGAYVAMELVLVGGTGAGQRRPVSAYAGGTRTATVFPAWAVAPDATTRYEVRDGRAGAREALGLSIEEQQILVTPQTTAAGLAPYFGQASLDLTALADVETFLTTTGLSRSGLHALLTQGLSAAELAAGGAAGFFINATGEADPPLRVVTDATDPNRPFQRIANLTLARLDRFNRFSRLINKLDWSAEAADWALRSIGATAIDVPALVQLAAIQGLARDTGLGVLELCAFWADLKTTGRGDGPAPADLFDRTFNAPAVLAGADPYASVAPIPFDPARPVTWDPSVTTGPDGATRGRLRAALRVSDDDLTRLARFVAAQLGRTPPLVLDLAALSWLFRLAAGARVQELPVEQSLLLLRLERFPSSALPPAGALTPTVSTVVAQREIAAWLTASPFTVWSLAYVIAGLRTSGYRAPYEPDAIASLVASLAALATPARVTPAALADGTLTAEGAASLFAALVDAELITPDGISRTSAQRFAAAAATFPLAAADLEGGAVGPADAAAAFAALVHAEPPLLVAASPGPPQTATLSPLFTGETDLAFLFPDQAEAANKRAQVAVVLLETRRRVAVSELAALLPLTAASLTSGAVGAAAAERALAALMDHVPPIVERAVGAGERRTISAYDGPTRTATVSAAWSPIPAARAPYAVVAIVTSGTAQAGSLTDVALGASASLQTGAYVGMRVALTAGAGAGEASAIVAYDGLTRTARVARPWAVAPDASTQYEVASVVAEGLARAVDATHLQLDAAASSTNGAYDAMALELVPSGTLSPLFGPTTDLGFLFPSAGAGQVRTITAYTGAPRAATVTPAWDADAAPDATSHYRITRVADSGTAQGATATTITLAASASTDDGAYDGMAVRVTGGNGTGGAAVVAAYVGATRTATLAAPWTTVPDATSAYDVVATVATGDARGGAADTVLLAPDASADDGAYMSMSVALVAAPDADLQRGQIAQSLLALRATIERVAGALGTAAATQHGIALQGLADFLGTSTQRLAAMIPVATASSDLSDELADLLTPPAAGQVPDTLEHLIDRLARAQALFEQLGTSAVLMRGVAELPRAFNVGDVLDLSFADVRALSALAVLDRALGEAGGVALVDYLRRPADLTPPGPKADALAALTGWPAAQIAQLSKLLWPGAPGFDAADAGTVAGLVVLKQRFDLVARTGLDVGSLLTLQQLATRGVLVAGGQVDHAAWVAYGQAATLTLGALAARFSGTDFAAVDEALTSGLNEARRDALVGYAIHLLGDTLAGRSPEALFEYLLIDVEMAGCAQTSYIAQGISALQLYQQRCRLMLEPGITDLSQIPAVWWEWLTTYRVWEANRKVFLYPENYLRPGARSGATPAFDALEQKLLETHVTDATASAALRDYLGELTTISNLVLSGAYEARQPQAGTSVPYETGQVVSATSTTVRFQQAASTLFNRYEGMTVTITAGTGKGQKAKVTGYDGQVRIATVAPAWKTTPAGDSTYLVTGPREVERLVLVGRTADDPDVYYHRSHETTAGWSPWSKIPLTIPTPLVAPVLAFDQLLIFWTELKVVDGSQIASGTDQQPTAPHSKTLTSHSAAVRFSYLGADGTWSAPQTAAENVVFDYQQDYASVAYLDDVLGGWIPYLDGSLVVWRKVYPLQVPGRKVTEPRSVLRGEQVIVNHGFAAPWAPDQPWPDPDEPDRRVNPDRRQLETSAYELALRNIALADAPLYPNSGSLPLVPSVAVDTARNRAALDTALFRYLPDAPQPYIPILGRSTGTLGIAPSATGNVFLDDFYADDYPGASMPDRPAPEVPLLAGAAGRLASVTTVTNRPGSFVFDNGDEAFLVRASDPGLLTVSESLLAQAATPPMPAQNFYLTSQQLTTTHPAPPLKDLTWRFERISTDAGRRLAERLAGGGLASLLGVEAQRTPEAPFSRLRPAVSAIGPETDQLDFRGAYGTYFWELFFHAPFLVADTLGSQQRFAEAQAWLQYIFDPTQQPDPDDAVGKERFWRFLPFRDMTLQSLAQTLADPAQVQAYDDDPLDPDAIARLRIGAYAKAVVLRYVTNLLDWADFLFTQDTRESIDQATNLYVLAGDLLGPCPEILGSAKPPAPASFDDVQAAYDGRTIQSGTVASATATTIVLDQAASGRDDAYTGFYITLTAGPGAGDPPAYVLAYDGATRTATLATPWGTVPTTQSSYSVFASGIPQFLIRMESSRIVHEALAGGATLDAVPFNDVGTYFCVPENDQLVGMWDRVDDRLYKIRHCMNIAGQVRPLALFAPPLNPADLIAGRRADGTALAVAAHAQMPVPKYRFTALLERARGMAAAVSQLGGALLGALERRDGEALALLQSSQQRQLLELTTLIKQQQVEDAVQTGVGLDASLAAAQARQEYYNGLVAGGMSPAEVANIATMTLATVFNVVGSSLRTASSIAYAAPQVGSPFAMTYGGQQLGSSLATASAVFDGLALLSNFGAQLSATLAQYQRREAEWAMQATLATRDIEQIVAQQAGNVARLKMAERDLVAHRASLEQNVAMDQFLKAKFTSQELYQWMATRLSTLHFQTYAIALDLARSVQRAYQYELGTDDTFVSFGYWDDGRRGLLAGEGLTLALHQMEQAYLERNGRALEIEKTISLLQVNPRAVLDLIATGECTFELPEKLFDDDFPGHYARRVKSLAVSLPAITGPYQNIHATLTQLTNQLVVAPDPDTVSFLLGTPDAPIPGADTLRSNWWANQQIALSSGVSDSGVFELSPADERYLPFEGTGAVSTWRLSMPKQTNRIDFGTISDVVLTLRYTAHDGGARFRDQVVRLGPMRTTSGSAFLPLAQRYSTDWYAFLHQPPEGTRQVLDLNLEDLIPAHVERATITGFFFHLDVAAGVSASAGKPYLHLRLGGAADVAFDLDAGASHTHMFASPPAAGDLEGPASLQVVLADTPPGLLTTGPALDPKVVENAVLVLFYEGRVAW